MCGVCSLETDNFQRFLQFRPDIEYKSRCSPDVEYTRALRYFKSKALSYLSAGRGHFRRLAAVGMLKYTPFSLCFAE